MERSGRHLFGLELAVVSQRCPLLRLPASMTTRSINEENALEGNVDRVGN
jgi:hypothetical protein